MTILAITYLPNIFIFSKSLNYSINNIWLEILEMFRDSFRHITVKFDTDFHFNKCHNCFIIFSLETFIHPECHNCKVHLTATGWYTIRKLVYHRHRYKSNRYPAFLVWFIKFASYLLSIPFNESKWSLLLLLLILLISLKFNTLFEDSLNVFFFSIQDCTCQV